MWIWWSLVTVQSITKGDLNYIFGINILKYRLLLNIVVKARQSWLYLNLIREKVSMTTSMAHCKKMKNELVAETHGGLGLCHCLRSSRFSGQALSACFFSFFSLQHIWYFSILLLLLHFPPILKWRIVWNEVNNITWNSHLSILMLTLFFYLIERSPSPSSSEESNAFSRPVSHSKKRRMF